MPTYTLTIDPARCKGCGLCVEFCPRGNMRISTEITPRGVRPAEVCDETACSGCRLCVLMCPDVAIALYRRAEEEAGVT